MKDTKKCHRVKTDKVVRKISELYKQTPFSEGFITYLVIKGYITVNETL